MASCSSPLMYLPALTPSAFSSVFCEMYVLRRVSFFFCLVSSLNGEGSPAPGRLSRLQRDRSASPHLGKYCSIATIPAAWGEGAIEKQRTHALIPPLALLQTRDTNHNPTAPDKRFALTESTTDEKAISLFP